MFNNEKHYDLIKFEDGDFSLDVKVSSNEDTVWLTIKDISELFRRDVSVVGKHIRGIINSGELNKKSVWAKFAYTASDGKIYNESNLQKMQIPFSDIPIFLYFFSMNNKNIIVLKK